MLPGFRFLFATVLLATSVLVFGLGAAALLRAAHEEFASLPSWRLAQQPMLAPQFEMSGPTLAMLRVEALAAKPSADKPRQQAIIRDLPRDVPRTLPESAPVAVAPQDSPPPRPDATADDLARDAGQAASANAAPEEQAAILNAQVSMPDFAAPNAAAGQTGTFEQIEPRTQEPDVLVSQTPELKTPAPAAETKKTDARFAAATASAPAASETRSFEAKSSDQTSATEASEPTSTETVAALERSSEATASATLPGPVLKKANRASARAAARRRAAIARARAAARAVQQQQQQQRQQQQSDPFGLFGAAPRT